MRCVSRSVGSGTFVCGANVWLPSGERNGLFVEALHAWRAGHSSRRSVRAGSNAGYGAGGNVLYRRIDILEPLGYTEAPKTWEELNALAPKFLAAGIIPLAHGGQAWQEAYMFEAVALGIGGADFYRKALVDLDDATLRGPEMVESSSADAACGRQLNTASMLEKSISSAFTSAGRPGYIAKCGHTPAIVCPALALALSAAISICGCANASRTRSAPVYPEAPKTAMRCRCCMAPG